MGCCGSSDSELLNQLARSPFFFLEDETNASYLQSLSKRFTQRKYFANQILWSTGDSEATFNVIIEGEVRLEFKQDKQMVIISKKCQECFGLDALEYQTNRVTRMEYNCIAVTDLTVYQLSLSDLNSYWTSHKICHDKFIDSAIIPISAYLQSINVFSSINPHNASLLSSMFRWKKIHKNEILFEEGTLGEAFYIVAKGSVAVVVTIANPAMNTMKLNNNDEMTDSNEFLVGGTGLNMLDPEKLQTIRDEDVMDSGDPLNAQQSYSSVKETEDAKEAADERVVYEFKSGDYFGEVSLVIKIPRTATIKATQNTTLLELRKKDFKKFIPQNNAIRLELEQVAHERIAQSFRRYQIPLFNAVPLDMFHVLSQRSTIKYYKPGEVICDPDSEERALYVIAHGNVGVYVTKQRLNIRNDGIDLSNVEDAKSASNETPITPTDEKNSMILHDGNRTNTRRMSEKLNANAPQTNSIHVTHAHTHTPTPTSLQKRISQHLLPSNVYLLANMTQRDKLNRELIRLSFISSQAMSQNTKEDTLKEEDSELMDEKEASSSSSSSPVPTPHTDDDESDIITEHTIKLKPKVGKQYPITPPPPDTDNKRLAINSLKVNVKSTKTKTDSDKAHSEDATNTPSFHTRFHTHAGFETPDQDTDDKANHKKKRKKKKNDRRNSENALFRMKITSPQVMKSSIYTRNEKFVRIADLMIPDANVDKLRCASRRGSHVSIAGDHARDSTEHNSAFHMGSPSIIKIDPSDPSAFENLDFAKSITVRSWKNNANANNPNGSNGLLHKPDVDGALAPQIHTPTNTQLTEMIRKQEKEHETRTSLKDVGAGAAAEDAQGADEDVKYEERVNEKGMKLRDFKSSDGDIIYTEIEVSVLGTGNFFGETSLVQEAEENEDDYEDLPQATPTSTTRDIDIEIATTEPVLGSKPSVLDIINKQNSANLSIDNTANSNEVQTGNAHASAPSSSVGMYQSQKKSKKKIDIDQTRNKTYRGSHTTFRCITGCVIYSITKKSIDEFFSIVPSARPWFDIMLSKYNVSLDTVLHIPRAARYFTLFLESEYAQENIHYVLSVNEYRDAYESVDSVNQMEMAQIICDHFISDQGSQQINVSYHQRKLILDRIRDGDIDKFIFDVTQKAIYTLLQRDCFPRFKQSHFFHEFLNEAENLALLTKEQYEMQLKEEQNITNENRKHSKLLISSSAQSVLIKTSKTAAFNKNRASAFNKEIDDDENESNILKHRSKTFT